MNLVTRYPPQETTGSLPGLRGLEHIGLAVPDLEQATDFFAEVLGWPVVYATGPFADPGGTWMADNFGLHPRAAVRELALVRTPFVNFELLEGTAPDQDERWPRLLDIGGLHLSLYVDDVGPALEHLVARGCTSLGAVKAFLGPEAGERAEFAHLRTPIGLYLELVSFPHGRAYEPEVAIAGWNPARPDDHARAAFAPPAG